LRVCGPRWSRGPKTRIKEGQYPAILTGQAWLIKDLFHGKKITIFLQDTAGSPERTR